MRVLAAQRPAADRHPRPVVVHDELLAGQPVVPVGPAAGELPRAVEADDLRRPPLPHAGQRRVEPGHGLLEGRHDQPVLRLGRQTGGVLDRQAQPLEPEAAPPPAEHDHHLAVRPEGLRVGIPRVLQRLAERARGEHGGREEAGPGSAARVPHRDALVVREAPDAALVVRERAEIQVGEHPRLERPAARVAGAGVRPADELVEVEGRRAARPGRDPAGDEHHLPVHADLDPHERLLVDPDGAVHDRLRDGVRQPVRVAGEDVLGEADLVLCSRAHAFPLSVSGGSTVIEAAMPARSSRQALSAGSTTWNRSPRALTAAASSAPGAPV